VPDYLPLCAFRLTLLPVACRSCAWWQTTGSLRAEGEAANETRRRWTTALELTWGSTGLLLAGGGPAAARASASGPAAPDVVASIHYAPAASLPRLRSFPFAPVPADAVLIFCLRSEGDRARPQGKRLLQKALALLKDRGLEEVYAFARVSGGPEDLDRCEFFSLGFLEANGFQRVQDDGTTFLMRADLRSLLSLFTRIETTVRRALGGDPAPSPATLARRGTG
jgi:hypothetical protein